MNYKYKRNQLFGKRLKVPKTILRQIYNCSLAFEDYTKYQLEDKIPVSCLTKKDRMIVEKFGIEKCKKLDWELIEKEYESRELLLSINPQMEDLNYALYELMKNQISPSDYSSKMKTVYYKRIFDLSLIKNDAIKDLVYKFNYGYILLPEIISNWDLFKEKDLSYCLLHDYCNKDYNISDDNLKEFMSKYKSLVPFVMKFHLGGDVYKFINKIFTYDTEDEAKEFIKHCVDMILNNEYIELTNEEYKEIFKYTSLEDYLKKYNSTDAQIIVKELNTLPQDYIFNISIPFSNLLDYGVLSFVGEYGLKNIVDFDNECGHFFTKNNCEMLKLMNDMYLHYGGNIHDPSKTIYTKKNVDENGNYIDRPYTKDEFYEAMRRMIMYGPTDGTLIDKAPDYRTLTGEFRVRNSELYISEQAPEELQKLFYTKAITPHLLFEHPEYIEYLKDKIISTCFKAIDIQVIDNHIYKGMVNFYEFIGSKADFNNMMNFIIEYRYFFDIIYNKKIDYCELKLSNDDDFLQIQNKVDELLKKIILEKNIKYPEYIPSGFKSKFPTLFISDDAPKELREKFYNREITSKFLLSNSSYLEFVYNVDLETLYKPMKLYHGNLVKLVTDIFGQKNGLNVMLEYGDCLEKIYAYISKNGLLWNYDFFKNLDSSISRDDFFKMINSFIYQNIIDGNIKYSEDISSHFKEDNPTLFLGSNVSQEICHKFYNREFTLDDFNTNTDLVEQFGNTNVVCGFSTEFSWMIPLFNNMTDSRLANLGRLKAISEFLKIDDNSLQKIFKEYIINVNYDIDIDKIGFISQILLRICSSNSSEMYNFRSELATQILRTDNPMESLVKIEDIFLKNNLPFVGKIYKVFEILHPDFKGFNFSWSSRISPILQSKSNRGKQAIIFSDLLKSFMGSNNRNFKRYLENLEQGNKLFIELCEYKKNFDSLDDESKQILQEFLSHLNTLYNNTKRGKNSNLKLTGKIDEDIFELKKLFSSNGKLDYNLSDRIIRMYCYFAGIDTLEQAKRYMIAKVDEAEKRNIEASRSNVKLENGCFVKGIGGIKYLSTILQNGSNAKEFLGEGAGSDATPLDTDLWYYSAPNPSLINIESNGYGPIYFILKNRGDRFLITRRWNDDENQEIDKIKADSTEDSNELRKRINSKLEAFYTGVLGGQHYGIRTGFASSEIDYIVMEKFDPRVGLEIAINGFYIPVANTSGKIVFTYDDYKKLREKMSGLSYYDADVYEISHNLVSPEILKTKDRISQNMERTNNYFNEINILISKVLLASGIKKTVNGFSNNLLPGIAEIYSTGSTSRNTNVPNDSDFDYVVKIDREIYFNNQKLFEFKQKIKEILHFGDGPGGKICGKIKKEDGIELDIEISLCPRTDKVEFSTDVSLKARLDAIKQQYPDSYMDVLANIVYAKELFKSVHAYKSEKSDSSQGGLGGIGIENWILQHGGSLYDAAKSFVDASEKAGSFEKFCEIYQVYDFGSNHYIDKAEIYEHDNFVGDDGKMTKIGYERMLDVLKKYIYTFNQHIELNNKHL